MRLRQPRNFSDRRHPRPGPDVHLWCRGLVVVAVLTLLGCGSQARHELLSFFFDGVPEPDSTATAETLGLVGSEAGPGGVSSTESDRSVPALYVHAPYEDRGCDNCHLMEGSGRFAQTVSLIVPERQICYECHDDMMPDELQAEFPWVHGPVAAGLCTGCHSPHRSTHEFFLHAEAGRDLCLRCHDEQRLVAQEFHGGEFDACLQCHQPHAGAARAELASVEPVVEPAVVPAVVPGVDPGIDAAVPR